MGYKKDGGHKKLEEEPILEEPVEEAPADIYDAEEIAPEEF